MRAGWRIPRQRDADDDNKEMIWECSELQYRIVEGIYQPWFWLTGDDDRGYDGG